MGFFATFWTWLNDQLATYIGDNTARLAAGLEPAAVTLVTVYVMAWGYLQLMGRIEEPVSEGLRRIALVVLVIGVGLRLWLYDAVIVDTFYRAPAQVAAWMVGSSDPVATIDTIWERGGTVAGALWSRGPLFGAYLGICMVALVVWFLVGTLCVYAMFLIALSSIASSVLLAMGPLFVVALLFDGTRRFFFAWLAQLAHYGLVTVLTVLLAALLLQLVGSYAAQTAGLGADISVVDALNLLLVTVLVFLILRQVMPIASALAGGIALSTLGTGSRAVGLGLRGGYALAGKPVSGTGAEFAQTVRVVVLRGGDLSAEDLQKATVISV